MSLTDTRLTFGKGINQVDAETSIPEGFARRIVNLDVANGGTLKQRSGTLSVLSMSDCHSLWSPSQGDAGFFSSGGNIYRYDGTTATVVVAGISPGLRISYADLLGNVYWSNGAQSGVLVGGVSNQPWGDGGTGPLGQTYMTGIRGGIVRYYRGRIYAVDGRTIWATEPQDYQHVDLARGFLQLESEILLFEPVSSGIYVGTPNDGVRFFTGPDFKQFTLQNADSLVPVRGSGLSVDGALFESPGQGAVWLTNRGWVFGAGDGSTRRLTDKQMALPDYASATSVLREANGMRQIMSFATGGTDSAQARDVITSEIIHNGVLKLSFENEAMATVCASDVLTSEIIRNGVLLT